MADRITYLLNAEKWETFMRVNKFFQDYVKEYGGVVSDIQTPPDVVDAVFTVETMTFDFSGDLLKEFVRVSEGMDDIAFEIVDEDTVRATVRVRNMWRTVRSGE